MTDNRNVNLPYPEIEVPIAELSAALRRVEAERLPLSQAAGRVVRRPITADRDSPAADVSAMDGYAMRLSDLAASHPLPIHCRIIPGHMPPAELESLLINSNEGVIAQIFTGGVVPQGFELVIKREDTVESPTSIVLSERALGGRMGENIRRRGENAREGTEVIAAGSLMHAGMIAVAANFGAATVDVSRPVRVSIVTTGDELCSTDAQVAPWQLRDSNGPTLHALWSTRPWLDVASPARVHDDFDALCDAIKESLAKSDALVLTGGVSAGDFDRVPAAIERVGGHIHFHKLPIRPGKPILGATGPNGQLILGLPGNPVSAAVCALRFGLPLLASMAEYEMPRVPVVAMNGEDTKTLPMHWFRLVQINARGEAELVATRGSGDLVSLGASHGFVHVPPQQSGRGPWSYWAW